MKTARAGEPPGRFEVPRPPTPFVERARLLERFNGVVERPLTAVTAPAGHGKTTLVANWCRSKCDVPVAWLDIGSRKIDGDQLIAEIASALSYLTMRPLDENEEWLDTSGRLSSVATARLAAALAGSPESVLVIDFGRAAAPLELLADIALLVEGTERCGVHLLTLSRFVPPLDLTHLQLRGRASQIDARFGQVDGQEVSALVAAYSGEPVDAFVATELAELLGGWIVGALIIGLTHPGGGHHSADELLRVAADGFEDYFVAEVLGLLPDETRIFLRLTSAADELVPHLCDRLTGRNDSESVLRSLARLGLPIGRGSSRTGPLRYQKFFHSVIERQFRRDDPHTYETAVRRAAGWYEEHGQPLRAAERQADLENWDEFGRVLLWHYKQLLDSNETERLAALAARAPRNLVRGRPILAVANAWAMLMDGRVTAMYDTLNEYRPWMSTTELLMAEAVQSGAASWVDDSSQALKAADRTVELRASRDHEPSDETPGLLAADVVQAAAHTNGLLAGAYTGLWDRGRRHLVDLPTGAVTAAPRTHLVRWHGSRAVFLALAGEATLAMAESTTALAIAREGQLDQHRSTGDALYAAAESWRLQGQYERASNSLQHARDLATIDGRRNLITATVASQAHLLVDSDQPESALAVVGDHAPGRHKPPTTLSAMLSAAEARAHAAMGNHTTALTLLATARATSSTAIAHVAVALALGDIAKATATLEHWPADATTISQVRRAVAAAAVFDAQGFADDANRSLATALSVAAPHNLLSPFVELGTFVTRALRRAGQDERESAIAVMARRATEAIARSAALDARLTARELDVLGRLANGLTLREIASDMIVSINTVKSHLRTIYRKLGTNSRAGAVEAWRSTLRQRPSE